VKNRGEFESLPVGGGSPGSGRVIDARTVSDRLCRWGALPNGTSCAIERMRHVVPVLATEARIGEGSDALALNAPGAGQPGLSRVRSSVTQLELPTEPSPTTDYCLDGRMTQGDLSARNKSA
jgi:hypothetical protein